MKLVLLYFDEVCENSELVHELLRVDPIGTDFVQVLVLFL